MTKYPDYLDLLKPEEISVKLIWEVIARALFKGEVSRVQYDEMKMAFFMGFTECLAMSSSVSEKLTEEQALAVLSRIHKELEVFHNEQIHRLLPPKGTA